MARDLTEYLNQLNWNNKLAVATSLERVQNDRLILKWVHCFDESTNIQKYPTRIFMRNDFPFQIDLNKFIERVIENGLVVKWAKRNIFGCFKEQASQQQYIEYTFESQVVLCQITIGLLLFASLVLIFERIVHKKAQANNTSRFWRYIEMSIDPNRYFLLNDLSF